MNTVISNSRLTVTVSDYGAQLQSVLLDGTERLWQGDPAVWDERSPILFPFVGRIKEGKYTFEGKEYPAEGPHGFARRSVFSLVEQGDSFLTYRLTASKTTKAVYPFDFVLDITYRIEENRLTQSFTVTNPEERTIYYSFGAHPGFLVPPTEGSAFDDWYLEFAEGETLNQAMLDGMFMSRRVEPCRFAKGNKIALYHAMFDDDAFILTGLKNKKFVLKNDKTKEQIASDCSDFEYIAFWQAAGSGAKYVCIEPWNGLPSDATDPEDLTVKRDMRTLAPKKSETCSVSYTFD